MWVTLSGERVRGRRRRKRSGSSYPKPGVVGVREGGEWEGGAAFQRGMMEVFVIGRRDEMRRAVDGQNEG